MKRVVMLLALLFAGLAVSADQGLNTAEGLRRFAMFIGSNEGGPDRVTLRYAERDARSMAAVMHELGGIGSGDTLVLLAPNTFDVESGFQMMSARVGQAREEARRVEFLFYYSGHSDEQGLLLGGARLAYADLKSSIEGIDADVNIAVLDSCFSGAFTRLKGGTRKPPFLMDESVEMKGHAFLTSSSADEAAQESDGIQSSFFTHYLISGLRGAADSTRDGQVSLNEAYHYAFNETLSRTEQTQAGAQHASYNIQLTGTGDLTLTDLRVAVSAVLLGEDVEGRLFVRDGAGNLVLETRKIREVPVRLALPAGSYGLSLDSEGRSFQTRLTLRPGAQVQLSTAGFSAVRQERAMRRGPDGYQEQGDPGDTWQDWGDMGHSVGRFVQRKLEEILGRVPAAGQAPEPLPGEQAQQQGVPTGPAEPTPAKRVRPAPADTVPFNLGIVPFVSSSGVHPGSPGVPPAFNLSFNLLVGYSYEIRGAELGGVLNITERNVAGGQAAGVGNIVGGDLRGVDYAGVFNIAGDSLAGLQSAGVFNIGKGKTIGVQAAGVFNLAEGDLFGAQLAGVFNTAARVRGAQLGVVNVSADVEGHADRAGERGRGPGAWRPGGSGERVQGPQRDSHRADQYRGDR
jgi:hypothetical protein